MASEGQAKIALILELKNRMKTSLMQAKEHVSSTVADMKAKMAQWKNHHVAAFRAMRDEIPMLGRAMDLLGNPFALVTAGVIALGAAGIGITKFSAEWEKGLAKINVTAQLSKDELGNLSDRLLEIGSKSATPLNEIPDAFNRIISAGLNVNESLKALDPTLRAAKAGFTDTTTVAAAGVAVMKSSGEDINKVYDVLFATLNKGNAEFKDIANYLPKLVPDARNLGFSLGEVAGAFAYMTAQGQTAEQSTTLLQNTFKAFGKSDIRKNLESIGVKVFDKGKVRPFVEIINELQKSLTGLTDEQRIKRLEGLGLDGEASRGLAAMVQNAKELGTTIDFTVNSTGQLDAAYENAKTSMDAWTTASNQFIVLIKPIGDFFLRMVAKSLEGLNALIGFIAEYKSEILISLGAMGTAWLVYNAGMIAAGIVTTALTAKQWLLNIAMDANPIGLIIIAIGALVMIVATAIKKYSEWGAALLLVMGPLGWIVNMVMSFKKHWDEITSAFKDGGILAGLKQIGLALLDALLYPVQQLLELLGKIPGVGKLAVSGAEWIHNLRKNVLGIKVEEPQTDATPEEDPFAPEPGKPKGATPGAGGTGGGGDPIDKITGAASQQKNLTINIDSFVKGGINTAHTNLQNMDETQLEQWMTNMFMRVIRNAEMNY